ncbi:outer membrane protein assembly factor BamB family protein [Rhodothermus profundi]|uniref:outer membrane protein assembly factor BamB family protein n=1 Tax=Rhodothermus profundi TaxID=633813 RepID=UPI001FE55842|nr:PQQ-binding-like beta-propeller repeat protein [Rhodothermus profundi]
MPPGALMLPAEDRWVAVPPLMVHWRRDIEAAPAQALVAGRILLVTNRKGEVRAFELPEGRRRGMLDLGRDVSGKPARRGALLLVPVALDDASIVAYDLYRRRVVWRRMGEGVEAGLVLTDSVVYVAERWGRVYALHLQNGREHWLQEPSTTRLEGVRARPVAVGDWLVVADKRGRVVALEMQTGRPRWRRQLWPVYADLITDGHHVFISTTRGRLVALQAASGAVVWTYALPDTTVRFTAPVVAGQMVYVAGGDGMVRALERTTGTLRWSWSGRAAIAATPVADTAAGVLYVGDLRNRLVALELTTGQLRWETNLQGGILALETSAFGLVVLARPRHVYLLRANHDVATHP